ncbi:MAG TPA: ATP-binding cassette domain-containing protein [Actinomycetes bacterium]|nr:ATP-binding cassette domain-containing protein [Actinomycetes bacterium]
MSVIRIEGLTKRFGAVLAVDNLNFVVAQGTVTGFLGPNGAGKTTTLRTLLGLITPTAGTTRIHGRPYRQLTDPIRHVGALLESSGFHPGRSARNHLQVVATAAGLPAARADEVLAQVGLAGAARRRVSGFSLGMRQRLGLATALLGDPQVLVLDEPANGLDPEGVHWLRGLLRHLADQGRTVLVSSHVLAEIAQTVDQVVIIAAGRLVTQSTLAALTDQAKGAVRVRSADPQALRDLLVRQGVSVELTASDELVASGVSSEQIGRVAAGANIAIYEMRSESANLEKAFLQLTGPQGGTS